MAKEEAKKSAAKKPAAEAKGKKAEKAAPAAVAAPGSEAVPADYIPRLRKHYDEVVRPALARIFGQLGDSGACSPGRRRGVLQLSRSLAARPAGASAGAGSNPPAEARGAAPSGWGDGAGQPGHGLGSTLPFATVAGGAVYRAT